VVLAEAAEAAELELTSQLVLVAVAHSPLEKTVETPTLTTALVQVRVEMAELTQVEAAEAAASLSMLAIQTHQLTLAVAAVQVSSLSVTRSKECI
jgi:hypothetical protein